MGGMGERRRMVPVLSRIHGPGTGQGRHTDENIQNEYAVDEKSSADSDVTTQHARSHHGCPLIALRVTVGSLSAFAEERTTTNSRKQTFNGGTTCRISIPL